MHVENAPLDVVGFAWRLGATLFFVLLNGFFVAAEFALVKVRGPRVKELADQGVGGAKRINHILGHLDLYLSACQLGITISSLVLGALGEPAVSRLLIALAGAAGLDVANAEWVSWLSIGIAFAIITILHMTVGEQAPKMWALERSESTAIATGGVLYVFTLVFRPFIRLINNISNAMLTVVGLPPGGHGEEIASLQELKAILVTSAGAGHLSRRQLDMAQNILRLTELEVRHIMVARVDVDYLSMERPVEVSIEAIRDSSHSRLPLCERDLDSIVGFVHGKDVLERVLSADDIDLTKLARAPLFVPDTMSLSTLLREMQVGRDQLAAVIDEHGTMIGLAFREDALEQIVGPLGDEFDDDALLFREVEPGLFDVGGAMSLPALASRLDLTIEDDGGEETAAGYLIANLGRLPKVGDSVRLGRFELEVMTISKRRVTRLRLRDVVPDVAQV